MVLHRGVWQFAIGLTLGFAGALALNGIFRSLLVEIQPNDPLTFVGIGILLSAICTAVCLLAARRAAGIDPVAARRSE